MHNVVPATSNPFSTRFIRPGAIPYLFAPGESPDAMVQRLAESAWWGQIVGPHGSGKSTLLAALVEPLRSAGRRAIWFALHDGERSLPHDWVQQAQAVSARLVIVDGYEQLGLWGRLRLKQTCRRHEWGLLVTAHRDTRFPTLARTMPALDVAQAIVGRLLPRDENRISPEDVAGAFASCGGNLRETLFALYDRYEQVRARTACGDPSRT